MNTERPTPRTDAVARNKHALTGPACRSFVESSFARTLERELAEAREELAKLQDPVAVHINMLRGTIATPSREMMEHVWGKPPGPRPAKPPLGAECPTCGVIPWHASKETEEEIRALFTTPPPAPEKGVEG